MRWEASAPVEWPSEAALTKAWAELGREIAATPPTFELDEHGDGWELVAGEANRPGSYYRFVSPRLTRARVAGRIDDAGVIHGELAGVRQRSGPTAGALVADGLNHPRYVTSNGRIGPLRWHLKGTMAERLLTGEVSLPWVKGSVRFAEVQGRLIGQLRGRVTGVSGALLNMLASHFASDDVQRSLEEFVTGLAGSISELARGEYSWNQESISLKPAEDDAVEVFEDYKARLVASVRRLQGQMDHRPIWRRRGSVWAKEARATLPQPPSKPLAAASFGGSLRMHIIDELSAERHGRRLARLEETLAMGASSAQVRQMADDLAQQSPTVEVEPPNYDAMLDLDWLRSLRSVIWKLRADAL